MTRIDVRSFTSEDFSVFADAYDKTWGYEISDDPADRVRELSGPFYLAGNLLKSDWVRVATVDGKPAGLLCALSLRFFALPARRRNVGFFCRAAHTLAGWAKSRTQRQHAAHSAVQALGTPAGSIGSIFSTVGRSAPSTLFRQINRSPLLFRNDTKMPFFLRASTLFRI